MVDIILWIAFGALVGWVASMIMKTDAQQGAIANIIIGIIGAVLGGFAWRLITGDSADGMIGQLVLAVLGAMGVIAVWKKLALS